MLKFRRVKTSSHSELERAGDSLPRFAPGGSSDARILAGVVARRSYAPFLYAALVVPGALPLRVIVVTMFSTPLASSESLCVVFIVTIGTSPPPVAKTPVVLSVRPTVGPECQ